MPKSEANWSLRFQIAESSGDVKRARPEACPQGGRKVG